MEVPKNVAIIMDGNGRWAEARGRPRTYGHLKGARQAKAIITECAENKVEGLTLFAFSTENWFRPSEEVTFLMRLLIRYLRREIRTLMKERIRFKYIGDISRLPAEAHDIVLETVEKTKDNTGMTLVFALNYGGRQDIIKAARAICEEVKEGQRKIEEITEEVFSSYIETGTMPDPDLIIRTSGEYRVSNFLLWQMAYSEFYFSEKYWPEFDKRELRKAFGSMASRQRRFGRTTAQTLDPHMSSAESQ